MDIESLLDIEPKHLVVVKQILAKHLHSNTVWVYGSRVKFTAHKNSDLDLVVFDAKPTNIADAEEAFENSQLPYKVSIMLWHKIPTNFQDNIKQKYVVIQEPDLNEHIDRVGVEFYSRWKEYKLEEIATIQTGPFGSQLHMSDYKISGTPIITVEHLGENKILHSNLPLVSNEDKQRLIKYTLKEGDIVFSRVGSVDRRAYVSIEEDGWMFSGRLLRVRVNNKDKVCPKFLSFYFGQESFKETIRRIAVGATMPSINTTILSEIEVNIPPKEEQTVIASILTSLDDKIDLLQRQNKTLEQLAETLFRQWFVEEAEEIWKEGRLEDLIFIKYGKDHKKLSDGNIPLFGSGGLMRKVDKFLFDSESVLIPRKGSLSNLIYIDEPFWTVDTMFYTIMKRPNLVKFIYHFLKQQDLASMNVGSAVPSMTTELLNSIQLSIPSDSILEKFEITVKPIFVKIKSNQTQIRTLTQTRDTLLPKLMSGEVRVIV